MVFVQKSKRHLFLTGGTPGGFVGSSEKMEISVKSIAFPNDGAIMCTNSISQIRQEGTSTLRNVLAERQRLVRAVRPNEVRKSSLQKQAEITVGAPESSPVTGELHCWMQMSAGIFPESRWYRGL